MTAIRLHAEFHIPYSRGASVQLDGLAGTTLETEVDSHTARVIFPAYDATVPLPKNPYLGFSRSEVTGAAGAALRRVDVEVDADIDTAGTPVEVGLRVRPAYLAAVTVATRLFDEMRIIQPWLGLVGQSAEPAAFAVRNATTGAQLAVRRVDDRDRALIVASDWLTPERAAAAIRGEGLDSAAALLAQARYLAHWAPDRHPGLAVLLAAVACEARAKATLLDAAEPGPARALVEVLLRESRIFQQPAYELFGQVARAILGKSLKDDDRPLFNTVTELFTARNAVAHRGDVPGADKAADLVRAAINAFAWLDAAAEAAREGHSAGG